MKTNSQETPNVMTTKKAAAKATGLMSVAMVSLWSSLAMAQESGGMDPGRILAGVVDTLVYTVLGILMLVISYKVFGAIVPFDLNKELAEDDNPAVGVFMAGIFVAVGLIIASAIAD